MNKRRIINEISMVVNTENTGGRNHTGRRGQISETMNIQEFINHFNIVLNDQQLKAMQAVEGPTLLLAVPGSGKTTVLVTRLGYMLYCCGIDPSEILTLTYTRAATKDMADRFESMFGNDFSGRVEFRTINSICDRIVKYYASVIGKEPFRLESNEKNLNQILTLLYQQVQMAYPTENDLKTLHTLITYAKNMRLGADEIEELGDKNDISLGKIYKGYQAAMRQRGLMDYDDQMVYAYNILTRSPETLAFFQQKYKYICVDEAQDTSRIQHEIIALLAKDNENIFMVGDEDQSIYGFRAAYPEALLQFEHEHPGSRVLLMEENFRSNKKIVDAADQFISHNAMRHEKHMVSSRPEGAAIKKIEIKGRKAQYTYLCKVAESIKQSDEARRDLNGAAAADFQQSNEAGRGLSGAAPAAFQQNVMAGMQPDMACVQPEMAGVQPAMAEMRYGMTGVKPDMAGTQIDRSGMQAGGTGTESQPVKNTAVLFRNNESAIPLIDILERNNIPYRMRGRDLMFFTHRSVADVRNIIDFAGDMYNTDLFLQIYYKMSLYINKNEAQKACSESLRRGISVLDALERYCGLTKFRVTKIRAARTNLERMYTEPADKAVGRILRALEYGDYLERSGMSEDRVDILRMIGANGITAAELGSRLDELKNIILNKTDDENCHFILSTIHSSKGLEYDNVYLIDCADGLFPSTEKNGADGDEYEEERRLFYVAVTRAKDTLTLFSQPQGSEFLDELLGEDPENPGTENGENFKSPAKAYGNSRTYGVSRASQGSYSAKESSAYSKSQAAGRHSSGKAAEERKNRTAPKQKTFSAAEFREFTDQLGQGIGVHHIKFGDGVITYMDEHSVTIEFDDFSEKTFNLRILYEKGLIKVQ